MKQINCQFTGSYFTLEQLPKDELKQRIEKGEAMEFSHTLEDQIGGQMKAGFHLTNLYEDEFEEDYILNDYFPSFIATRAVKPAHP